MKYCADTWFLLELGQAHPKALSILQEIKQGKSRLVVPTITYTESLRKMYHRGETKKQAREFFSLLEASERVTIAVLDANIATEAATVSFSHHVPLADSLISVTAHTYGCDVLLAKDADYGPLVKKKYIKLHNW